MANVAHDEPTWAQTPPKPGLAALEKQDLCIM